MPRILLGIILITVVGCGHLHHESEILRDTLESKPYKERAFYKNGKECYASIIGNVWCSKRTYNCDLEKFCDGTRPNCELGYKLDKECYWWQQ